MELAPIFANTRPHADSAPKFLAVKIEPSQLRPIAFRVFTKKYNLTLKSDALKALAAHIGVKCGQSWRATSEPILDEIAKSWKRTLDSEPIVTEAGLLPIIKSLDVPHPARPSTLAREDTTMIDAANPTTPTTIDPKQYLTYIDAFSQPTYTFSHIRQNFEKSSRKPSLLPDVKHKPDLWRERYYIMRARVLRHEQFQAPSFQRSMNRTHHKLTFIKNLLGRVEQRFMLFGLLAMGPDANLYLEDADDKVRLDLSTAGRGAGWFTPGCFVLVEGVYTEDEIFRVVAMGHPVPEAREASRDVYSGLDFLGVGVERHQERYLRRAEQSFKPIKIVFAADCKLDDPRSVKALSEMLSSYEQLTVTELPIAIVLMGNFIGQAHQTNGFSSQYKEYWDSLAALIEQRPNLCRHTKFVFVPGENDPWSLGGVTVLPRRPIPKAFLNRITRACGNSAVYASNPCRLNYFTQELVIFRDNMIERLRRNHLAVQPDVATADTIEADPCGLDPLDGMVDAGSTAQNSEDDLSGTMLTAASTTPTYMTSVVQPLVRTILDQAHLSPFPISIRPILWDYAHVLRLFPLPTLLVLADTAIPAFESSYQNCMYINPGAISWGRKASWTEYHPATHTAVRKTAYI